MKTISEVFQLVDCEVCGNTRSVMYVDPILGNRVKSCICIGYRRNLAQLKHSQIPKVYLGQSFSDYKPELGEDKSVWRANKKSCKAICDTVARHSIVVEEGIDTLIYGDKGSGKTMLACIMLKELILQHGYTGIFVTAEELIAIAVESTKYGGDKTMQLNDLIDLDFVVVDNFHKAVALDDMRINDTVRILLDNFFSKRKNLGKCFILTSSVSMEHLLKKKRFIIAMAYTIIRHTLQGCYAKEARRNKISKLHLGD